MPSTFFSKAFKPIRMTKDKSVMQRRNPIGLFHKKTMPLSSNKEDVSHLRRVCSCTHNNPKRMPPSSKVDLHVHSPPKK